MHRELPDWMTHSDAVKWLNPHRHSLKHTLLRTQAARPPSAHTDTHWHALRHTGCDIKVEMVNYSYREDGSCQVHQSQRGLRW